MNQYSNLKLQALAIGSLPHNDLTKAMNVVKKDFPQIPFFPQLKNINKNEDMIIQFLEGLPSFLPSKLENFTIDSGSEEFFEDLETFFANYKEIISDSNSENLGNYGISKDFSSSFEEFEPVDAPPISSIVAASISKTLFSVPSSILLIPFCNLPSTKTF